MYPQIDNLVKNVFPKGTPPLLEIEKRSVLALIGSHPALTDAHPIPQNVIEIGGLNIIDAKPLPKDIDQFVASSKKGVVFFSLGTNIRPSDVGEKLAEELLNTMEKYSEYNFMWKFDKSFIKRSIPKNVMIGSFFPQRDILAHPKAKCFITHSGGLSTQESIWYGVPMITIPMLADQIRNSDMMVEAGLAVQLNIFTLTGKKFDDALNEILNNPKYSKNTKIKSELFRDRPMKPLDTACWWIDYVLRHPNPDHLKVPTNELGFLVSNSYDVVFTVLVVLLLFVYIQYKIIVCLCCGKSKAVQDRRKVKKN